MSAVPTKNLDAIALRWQGMEFARGCRPQAATILVLARIAALLRHARTPDLNLQHRQEATEEGSQ